MRRLVVVLLAALVGQVAIGPASAQQDADDTVRIIHLVIDGLHPDQIGPDTPVLSGLKTSAIWYEQARSIMASETLPNHVAMATGAYPERTGIATNIGRAQVGDTEPSDPDLGLPELLEATSFTNAIEAACPDLHTVTVFSKAYVWSVFSEDAADVDFPQPTFNIPVSDHVLDTVTVPYIQDQLLNDPPPDYLFANLGDVDRAGHIDESGFLGFPAFQRTAIQQTDTLVGTIVQTLQQTGLWEDTVLVVNSDHSMDWVEAADQSNRIDVAAILEADPRTSGKFFTAEEGGTAPVYLLDPAASDAEELLATAREILTTTEGVAEALYREPNPLNPGFDVDTVHPDWHLNTPRAGELFVYVEQGYRTGSLSANPVPGNHGHAVARPITMMVTGGWEGLADPTSIAASDPDAVDVVDDTAALPEQAEQVDLAPTYGWLLGVPEPEPDQWQGRVLAEAFTRQPAPACVAAAGGTGTGGGTGDSQPDPAPEFEQPGMPDTGAGAAALALVLLAGAVVVASRRTTAR